MNEKKPECMLNSAGKQLWNVAIIPSIKMIHVFNINII